MPSSPWRRHDQVPSPSLRTPAQPDHAYPPQACRRRARRQPGSLALDLRRHDHAVARALHRAVRALQDQRGQVPAVPESVRGPCGCRRLQGARFDDRGQPRTRPTPVVRGDDPDQLHADRKGPLTRPWAARDCSATSRITINSSGFVEGLVADSTFFQCPTRRSSRRWATRSSTPPATCSLAIPTTWTSPATPMISSITGGPYANNWALVRGPRHPSWSGSPTVDAVVDPQRGRGTRVRPVPPDRAEHVPRSRGREPAGQYRRHPPIDSDCR